MFIDTLDNILTALKSNIKQGLAEEEIILMVFDDKEPDNLEQLMNQIENDGLVQMGEKGYKHYWGPSYVLTLKGISFIESGGYKALELKSKKASETQTEKDNLELQQLRTNVQILVDQRLDYLKDRKRFIRNEYALWIGILISLIALLISIFAKK